jgi:hypothetical protein
MVQNSVSRASIGFHLPPDSEGHPRTPVRLRASALGAIVHLPSFPIASEIRLRDPFE